jgi:16S rRNA (uracil1498-N3)-methyltransferase
MKIHRFYTKQDLSSNILTIKDSEQINQIHNVLRLTTGESCIFFNNTEEVECEILEISKKQIVLSPINRKVIEKEHSNTTLCFALLKNENTEFVIQKATEIGIKNIIPIVTDRTIKKGWNQKRIEKIAIEATEQSGQIQIPNISEPKTLEKVLQENAEKKLLFFDMSGKENIQSSKKEKVIIFVGPEGGWSENEIKIAKEHNAKIVSLGISTLRAETACIIASYLYL